MNILTRGKGLRLGVAVAGISLLALPVVALAQSTSGSTDSGVDLSITPLIREINADQGQTITGSVDVTNNSSDTQTIYPLVRDFTASNDPDTGAPSFSEISGSDAKSVSQWVTFGKSSMELAAGTTGTVNYTMNVPAGAEPGGHYGAIFASTQAPDVSGTTGVAISARVGSLLLVTVSGDIRTAGDVVSFKADKSIYQGSPVNFTMSLKNTGNVHFKPTGTIDIAGPVSTSLAVNGDGANVLPNSVRNFSAQLTDDLPFGRYTATLDLMAETPNGDSLPLTATTTFWVIPLSTVLVVLLILIVLYLLMKSWTKNSDKNNMKK